MQPVLDAVDAAGGVVVAAPESGRADPEHAVVKGAEDRRGGIGDVPGEGDRGERHLGVIRSGHVDGPPPDLVADAGREVGRGVRDRRGPVRVRVARRGQIGRVAERRGAASGGTPALGAVFEIGRIRRAGAEEPLHAEDAAVGVIQGRPFDRARLREARQRQGHVRVRALGGRGLIDVVGDRRRLDGREAPDEVDRPHLQGVAVVMGEAEAGGRRGGPVGGLADEVGRADILPALGGSPDVPALPPLQPDRGVEVLHFHLDAPGVSVGIGIQAGGIVQSEVVRGRAADGRELRHHGLADGRLQFALRCRDVPHEIEQEVAFDGRPGRVAKVLPGAPVPVLAHARRALPGGAGPGHGRLGDVRVVPHEGHGVYRRRLQA